MKVSRRIFPLIERVFADSGYGGEKVAKATLIAVEIVDQANLVGRASSCRGYLRG